MYIRRYVHIEAYENIDMKQVSQLESQKVRKLESTGLSASNGTFVTKGEIESNFLTTPTEEPKLNHWVNTTLNQLVIQFKFHILSQNLKKGLKSAIFDKTSSGGDKKR